MALAVAKGAALSASIVENFIVMLVGLENYRRRDRGRREVIWVEEEKGSMRLIINLFFCLVISRVPARLVEGKNGMGVVIETKMSVASKSTRASEMKNNYDAEMKKKREEGETRKRLWETRAKAYIRHVDHADPVPHIDALDTGERQKPAFAVEEGGSPRHP